MDYHRAFKNLGVDILDALQGRDRVFQLAGDLSFKRRRRGTRQGRLDRHHG